jgi:hypothetical protein
LLAEDATNRSTCPYLIVCKSGFEAIQHHSMGLGKSILMSVGLFGMQKHRNYLRREAGDSCGAFVIEGCYPLSRD